MVTFCYILDSIHIISKTYCIKKFLKIYIYIYIYIKQNTFGLVFKLAESLTTPIIGQQNMNGLGKSFIHRIMFLTKYQVLHKIEWQFPYPIYKRKCYIWLEKCNNKNEKDCASCSKEDYQICRKSVFNKNSLHMSFTKFLVFFQQFLIVW